MYTKIFIRLTMVLFLLAVSSCQSMSGPTEPSPSDATATPAADPAPIEPATNTPTAAPNEIPEPTPTVELTPTPTITPPPPPDPVPLEVGSRQEGIGQIEQITYAPLYSLAVSGFGSLWLPSTGHDMRNVSRMDLETGEITARIQIGRPTDESDHGYNLYFSLAVTDEGVWVNDKQEESLQLIDPETNTIARKIPIGVQGYSVVVDGDDVWVSDPYTNQLLRVDTTTNAVEAVLEIGGASHLAVGSGSIWVVQWGNFHKVSRIDTATNAVIAEITVRSPGDIIYAEGSVWVVNASEHNAGVVRIDPATNEVAAHMKIGGAAIDIWSLIYGAGSVWVRVGSEDHPKCRNNFIARIDPASNTETARIYLICVMEIAFADGRIWALVDTSSEFFQAEFGFADTTLENLPVFVIAPE